MKKIFTGIIFFAFFISTIASAKLIKTCDSFLLLVDESASMNEVYKGATKIKEEKIILSKINENIPDTYYTGAMRAFSHQSAYQTKSLYPVGAYDRDKMKSSITQIARFRKWTSLGYALDMCDFDLKNMSGIQHLVIFSDGNENSTYTPPAEVAAKLHNKYPNLCIYAVQIGDGSFGKNTLQSIVNAVGCGKVYSYDSLADNDNFNDFIAEVFGYYKSEPTPTPAPPAPPAPKDSDKDGVYDEYDQCPGTPVGAPVNKEGCWVIDNIYFSFDKYDVKPEYKELIKEVSDILKRNPSIKLDIYGNTDSKGTSKYNINLSKKRAEAVKQEFIKNSICPCRLFIKYYGEAKPIASNKTPEGRALNRRVELKIEK